MELACYLKRISIEALVEWAPREVNQEAGQLANGEYHRFDTPRRFSIEPGSLRWYIQDEALTMGEAAERDSARMRAQEQKANTRRQNACHGPLVKVRVYLVNKSFSRPDFLEKGR